MTICFIVAGEYVSLKGIFYSQLLQNIEILNEKNFNTKLLILVPYRQKIREVLLGKGEPISSIRKELDRKSIDYLILYNPIVLLSPFSFIFKNFLIKFSLRKSEHYIAQTSGKTILHGRSNYATHFALKLKENLSEREDLFVSFDMRSILSYEFPLIMRRTGKYLFGLTKEWEHNLLKKCDVSFLSSNNGVKLLKLEHGNVNLHYVPIFGFQNEIVRSVELNRKHPENIAYVGSIGLWHSEELLIKVFDLFPNHSKVILSREISNSKYSTKKIDVRSVEYSKMNLEYQKIKAVVIPGKEYDLNYYFSVQRTSNISPSKAAEALSLGIPVIVNSELKELADFVETNKCGIVFKVDDQSSVTFNDESVLGRIDDPEFWTSLQTNALKIKEVYIRENVLSRYLENWETLTSTK